MTDISRLPRPTADVWEWQVDGACRGVDSSLFFHPDGERGPSRTERENAAKAICATCPVLAECAAHALAVREPYGVWGGMSEDDREARYVVPRRLPQTAMAQTGLVAGLAPTG